MQAILHLNNSSNYPSYIQGYRNEGFTNLNKAFLIAEREGITTLKVIHSGTYYEKRSEGWFLTSDSEICDLIHGLPPEGRLICKA